MHTSPFVSAQRTAFDDVVAHVWQDPNCWMGVIRRSGQTIYLDAPYEDAIKAKVQHLASRDCLDWQPVRYSDTFLRNR